MAIQQEMKGCLVQKECTCLHSVYITLVVVKLLLFRLNLLKKNRACFFKNTCAYIHNLNGFYNSIQTSRHNYSISLPFQPDYKSMFAFTVFLNPQGRPTLHL